MSFVLINLQELFDLKQLGEYRVRTVQHLPSLGSPEKTEIGSGKAALRIVSKFSAIEIESRNANSQRIEVLRQRVDELLLRNREKERATGAKEEKEQ